MFSWVVRVSIANANGLSWPSVNAHQSLRWSRKLLIAVVVLLSPSQTSISVSRIRAISLSGSVLAFAQIAFHASCLRSSVASCSSNPGAMPASIGNLRRISWQKEWKVLVRIVCGELSKNSYKVLAVWRVFWSAGTSILVSRLSSSCSEHWAISSKRSFSRVCISAAALRVNVTARIPSGLAPESNKRIRRVTSSQVFPVPADALTVALVRGSVAFRELGMDSTTLPVTGGDRERGVLQGFAECGLKLFVGIFWNVCSPFFNNSLNIGQKMIIYRCF